MSSILAFIFNHAASAHWVVFSLFMLAGVSIPISEDLLIIGSATLASATTPENGWKLYLAVFFGAYISDWIPYWIGRKFGANLWKFRWFARIIKRERLEEVKIYYKKYGMMTLIVGRFIPFGVRNCLFAAAGIGKMKFLKFLISDGVACLISTTTLFTIAYFFGKHYELLLDKVKILNIAIFLVFLFALIILFCYKMRKRKLKKTRDVEPI